MSRLFVFGLGYTAKAIAAALPDGWTVEATGSDGGIAFEDDRAVRAALTRASHVLSSVPPGAEGDAAPAASAAPALLPTPSSVPKADTPACRANGYLTHFSSTEAVEYSAVTLHHIMARPEAYLMYSQPPEVPESVVDIKRVPKVIESLEMTKAYLI